MADVKVPPMLHKMSVSAQKAWYKKNKMEYPGAAGKEGKSAAQAKKDVGEINKKKAREAAIAAAVKASKKNKALVSSSERVREMGRRRRESGEGLGGGLETNRDILSYVRAGGTIKAGRLGEAVKSVEEGVATAQKVMDRANVVAKTNPDPKKRFAASGLAQKAMLRTINPTGVNTGIVRGGGNKTYRKITGKAPPYQLKPKTGVSEETAAQKEPPFTPDKKKVRRGPGGPMSQAKWLAKQAMMKKMKEMGMKEEVESVEEGLLDKAKTVAKNVKGIVSPKTPEEKAASIRRGAMAKHYMSSDDKDRKAAGMKPLSGVSRLKAKAAGLKRAAEPYARAALKGVREEAEQTDEAIRVKDISVSNTLGGLKKAKPGANFIAKDRAQMTRDIAASEVKDIRKKTMGNPEARKAALKRADYAIAKEAVSFGRSGGVMHYDPKTEKSEKPAKGVSALDKDGNLVGHYKDLETAKKNKPGHTYQTSKGVAKEEVESVEEGLLDKVKTVAKNVSGIVNPKTPEEKAKSIQRKVMAKHYTSIADRDDANRKAAGMKPLTGVDRLKMKAGGLKRAAQPYVKAALKGVREEAEQTDEALLPKQQAVADKLKASELAANKEKAGYKFGKSLRDMKVAAKMKKEDVEYIEEVLKASDPMEKWIRDFQSSDNPKFAGKSKEKRREMAVAAKYAAERDAGMREDLDPVGREDKDIDNDGDYSDKTDVYLSKRRKAISSAIRKKVADKMGK